MRVLKKYPRDPLTKHKLPIKSVRTARLDVERYAMSDGKEDIPKGYGKEDIPKGYQIIKSIPI